MGRLAMALLGSQSEAEEAVQEALIAAHAGIGDFRGDGSVRAWLFAITRRLCARRLETRVRRAQKLRLVHDAGATPAGPDESLERRRRAVLLREALDTLRPTEREAVLLRFASGLSYREVGVACGIDEATARKRVSRALARLRVSLVSTEVLP